MAYSEVLDNRIRSIVAQWENTAAKKMFGGVCHLMNGNMVGGVYKDYLILRLGVPRAEAALGQAHVRPFDTTGRPMKGWVMVAEEGIKDDEALAGWLDQAREFVAELPPK